MSRVRVLVATQDRDLIVALLIFLREQPEYEVVGAVSDGHSIAVLARATKPDVLLVDRELLAETPPVDILPLRQLDSRPYLIALGEELGDGASINWSCVDATILKFTSPTLLLESLRQAMDKS